MVVQTEGAAETFPSLAAWLQDAAARVRNLTFARPFPADAAEVLRAPRPRSPFLVDTAEYRQTVRPREAIPLGHGGTSERR